MSRSGSGDEEVERCQARVGTTLRGKWRLDALLGVGGMAAVYSATHKLGKQNAIKILHPQIAVSKELRARFEQEAHAISKLGHPGTVQVVDIDATEEGSPFMVMELLEGESLGQRAFRLGGLHPKELFGYVDALLDVLGAAHAAGIVHRDIKPDNLFVTHDGRLKVLDFGIARMKESGHGVHTRTGAMLGTTAYMAPEQIHAKPIDGRADLFAVGATMFRVLSKRRIHEADSDAELLMKMGSTPAPSLRSVAPDLDPKVALVVDCALAFNRERRYPDAATMRADVQAVLRDEAPPFATRLALMSEAPTGAGGRAPDAGAPASVSPTQPDPGSAPPVAAPSAALATAAIAGELFGRDDTNAPGSLRTPPSIGVYPSQRGPAPSGFVAVPSVAAASAASVIATAQPHYAERTMNSAPPITRTQQGIAGPGPLPAERPDKRASLGVLVGIGALMILVGGLIAGAFLIWGGDSSAASKRGGDDSEERDERRHAKSAAPDDSESSAPSPTGTATDAPVPDTTGRTITKPKTTSTSGTTTPPRPSISAPTLPPDKPSATSAPTATATATSTGGKKPPKPPKVDHGNRGNGAKKKD